MKKAVTHEAVLIDYCLNDTLQSKQIAEREEAKAIGLVYSSTKLREVLLDMGFTKAGLGEWEYDEKIRFANFTRGDFWVDVGESRVYNGNYKTLLITDLIEILFKIIENNT